MKNVNFVIIYAFHIHKTFVHHKWRYFYWNLRNVHLSLKILFAPNFNLKFQKKIELSSSITLYDEEISFGNTVKRLLFIHKQTIDAHI